jgi:hypothetical protein
VVPPVGFAGGTPGAHHCKSSGIGFYRKLQQKSKIEGGAMTLGELIAFLKKRPKDQKVLFGFDHPHSYRGTYADLAFEPTRNTTVGAMLDAAKGALGKTYSGWKGGEYEMGEWVGCHLADHGAAGEEIGESLLMFMVGEQP